MREFTVDDGQEIDMAETTLITTTTPRSKTPAKNTDEPITTAAYNGLQGAFSYLNARLFAGALKNVVIVLQRLSHSGGHFAPDRFTHRADIDEHHEHELSLNPDGFLNQTDEFIISILLHEMVHEWQHHFGRQPPRKKYNYHDKEYAAKMESLGLMTSNTGVVGGKRTGTQMAHYIIPGGAYQQAFAELAATGWKLNLQSTITSGGTKAPASKTKFNCSACEAAAWGKPTSALVCKTCLLESLNDLPWLTTAKAKGLVDLIERRTMLAPQPDPSVASYDGQVEGRAA